MNTPFPTGATFTFDDVIYCVLSSKKVAHGWHVTAILASGDSGWWYGFYFPSRQPLPTMNSRANFQDGTPGEKGYHGR